ncbi:MAG TPA: glycosyltransferase family 4 protein [Thermoanaerobaculia bacterium]|nr:glycosyltransferase family 4 protein [Thermoanaerobaculia bacterium]
MRITYVLPRPELGGGNKVVFQHAALLAERGEEVTLLGEGPKPTWIASPLPYLDISAGLPRLPEQDLVIATFWTTLALARQLGAGPVAHFCQGYEGGLVHLHPLLPEIEAAYSLPLPAITVSPHLQEFLHTRFGRESTVVPPPLDPAFRPRLRLFPRRRPWIVIPGIFEAEVKGIPLALQAVRQLRASGLACRVLRLSVLPLSTAEARLLAPDRFLCLVPPAEVARELPRADLLFFPSRPAEGFGLPLLEAMASGVPAVASRIPSTVDMIAGYEAAIPLVAPDDPTAFAAAARELLHPANWRRARRAESQAVRRFRPEIVGERLAAAVRWARERALQTAG